jgi:hypothetical protein
MWRKLDKVEAEALRNGLTNDTRKVFSIVGLFLSSPFLILLVVSIIQIITGKVEVNEGITSSLVLLLIAFILNVVFRLVAPKYPDKSYYVTEILDIDEIRRLKRNKRDKNYSNCTFCSGFTAYGTSKDKEHCIFVHMGEEGLDEPTDLVNRFTLDVSTFEGYMKNKVV